MPSQKELSPLSNEITQKSASNLALAFILLPKEKRDAMVSLYAFCRIVDDIADEESTPIDERKRELDQWRKDLARVCEGQSGSIPVVQEFAPIIHRYQIPFDLMNELILGMEMDLEKSEYATWEELDLYCYRAASVVGLMSLRIFGYRHPETEEYAIALGKALQYTNILRDVKTDLEKHRIYLPSEEYQKYGVKREDLLQSRYTKSYYQFAEHYKDRTVNFYRKALDILHPEDRPNMIAAELMGAVYWQLLLKLIHSQYNIFATEPVRLTKKEKIIRILLTWLKFKLRIKSPNYGILTSSGKNTSL